METTDLEGTPNKIAVAQTIVAGLAQMPLVKCGELSTRLQRTPDEERTYCLALAVLGDYLDEPRSASLGELRLSVRALNVAEARGVTTLKEFMALPADWCQAIETSEGVRKEFADLRNFMLRSVGSFERMTFVEGKDALRHEQAEPGKV